MVKSSERNTKEKSLDTAFQIYLFDRSEKPKWRMSERKLQVKWYTDML